MKRRLHPGSQALFGALAAVVFACNDSSGGTNVDVPPLEITTVTSGSDLDPDGYLATVDGGTPTPIGINDTAIVGDASTGQHVVALSGVASNCRLEGSGSDTVAVADGSTADAGFSITCEPASSGEGQIQVSTATTGSNVDADGYAVLGSIPSTGTSSVGGVSAGSHTIGLDSVAAGLPGERR